MVSLRFVQPPELGFLCRNCPDAYINCPLGSGRLKCTCSERVADDGTQHDALAQAEARFLKEQNRQFIINTDSVTTLGTHDGVAIRLCRAPEVLNQQNPLPHPEQSPPA